ncbi:MAG: sialidase family protein [Actinomycetota bacterium]
MRARTHAAMAVALSLTLAALVTMPAAAAARFADERPAGYDINPKHQSNWEPTVAVDPNHPARVYQLITGINARACTGNCPGTSVLFRRSTNGGATYGPETFVCVEACKTVGWQFDPQIRVATDTNPACSCGTIYVAFLDQFDPGVQLFTSHDGGSTWSPPVTMNGGLTYMDKPILVISPSGRDVYVAFNDKFDNMVVASHDHGRSFLPPQKVNDDHLWWYATGGSIAPNGDAYFAFDGETSLSGHGHDFDGPVELALLRCSPSATTSCGDPTVTSFGVSAAPPPCPVPGCYADYFAATSSIAVDPAGHMVFAYTFSSEPNGPKSLYVRTSDDGAHWNSSVLVNSRGDSSFPDIEAGPTAGDVRLAWQDNRTGRFNTWYARSTTGGASWGPQVRLSNLGSGAPYKSADGYVFTDGDYFGMAVSSTGVAHVIWGEADGSSLYCCGDVWYTKGS